MRMSDKVKHKALEALDRFEVAVRMHATRGAGDPEQLAGIEAEYRQAKEDMQHGILLMVEIMKAGAPPADDEPAGFQQIVAGPSGELYGLDDLGDVWLFSLLDGQWGRLPSPWENDDNGEAEQGNVDDEVAGETVEEDDEESPHESS